MHRRRDRTPERRRLTWIDVVVIVCVAGLLLALLLPQGFGRGRGSYLLLADQANLRWQYQTLQVYEQGQKQLPPGVGHQFILAPWVEGTVERTAQNLDRYFTPRLPDARRDELARLDPATIWTRTEDLSSADTSYAGPGPSLVTRKDLLSNGRLPILADDGERGPLQPGGVMHVLLGDGNVLELRVLDEPTAFGVDPNAPNPTIPIRSASPHPLLNPLER